MSDTTRILPADAVKAAAREVGFSACGLTAARPVSDERAQKFRRWLAEGCHADMDYLARNADKRLDPRLLVEGARTIVSVAVNYFTPDEMGDFAIQSAGGMGENAWTIARYARGTDYHDVVKQMLLYRLPI